MSATLISFIQNRRRWNTLFLMVAFLSGGWIFLSRASGTRSAGGAPPPSPREGFSAPDFTLDLLGGGQITLSNLQGQVVNWLRSRSLIRRHIAILATKGGNL